MSLYPKPSPRLVDLMLLDRWVERMERVACRSRLARDAGLPLSRAEVRREIGRTARLGRVAREFGIAVEGPPR